MTACAPPNENCAPPPKRGLCPEEINSAGIRLTPSFVIIFFFGNSFFSYDATKINQSFSFGCQRGRIIKYLNSSYLIDDCGNICEFILVTNNKMENKQLVKWIYHTGSQLWPLARQAGRRTATTASGHLEWNLRPKLVFATRIFVIFVDSHRIS